MNGEQSGMVERKSNKIIPNARTQSEKARVVAYLNPEKADGENEDNLLRKDEKVRKEPVSGALLFCV